MMPGLALAVPDTRTPDPLPSPPWKNPDAYSTLEYIQAVMAIALVTIAGWYLAPLIGQLAWGLVYLLTVIALSLHLGRWPVLAAGILSAVAWDYVIIPPHFSFVIASVEDGLMLATYCVVALVASHLTGQIRAQEQAERIRERRAIVLLDLSRALAATRSIDEVAAVAVGQADALFSGQTALLLESADGRLLPHPAGTLVLSQEERALIATVRPKPDTETYCASLLQGGRVFGVLAVKIKRQRNALSSEQRDLIDSFAAQVGLQIEREQLRAANEREKVLNESEKLQRVLFDCVSHELKTPLAIMTTAVGKLNTSDDARRQNLLLELNTALKRLNRLVTNLLSQSRLETGVLRLRIDWCNVRDIINGALREAADVLAGHPVTVRVKPDLLLIKADAQLIEQVLFNLLHNAARHTPDDTAIEVMADVSEDKRQVVVSITDHGPGLAPEIRDDPFSRRYGSIANRSGGLGLGLSIVRGLILAHGGEVSAAEAAGGGSVFTIYLPYEPHGIVPEE